MDLRPLTVPDRLGSLDLGSVGLRHLRAFLVIAHSDTMTRAAATLGISQPTLSTRLRYLEDRLGVVLFRRGRDGVLITVDGRRLLDLISDPLIALNAALLELGGDGARVQVAAPPDLGPALRRAAEEALAARFPGRTLDWQEMPGLSRTTAFRERTVQAVVDWGPIDGAGGLTIFGRPYGLLMSAACPLAPSDLVFGDFLGDQPIAALPRDNGLGRTGEILEGLLANGVVRPTFVDIDGPDDLVSDPRTVMVAPEPDELDPRLVWRPFAYPFTESAWLAVK